jgi:hypothetical protein
VTVNQKLSQIIQRLERIETALQRSASNQIVAPCCQELNDPVTGNPIPILPPTPNDVLPEIDLACARMYALIKRKVDTWNRILLGPELPWVFAGGAGLYHALLAGLGQWTAAYMSQARLAELYSALVALGEHFQIDDVDYCAAAREAFDHQDVLAVPEAVWDRVHPLDRALFLVYWRLTGGLQGYENVDPDYDAPLGCCLPEVFQLLPVVRTFACASNSYDLDVIGESDPPGAAKQVIVNRAGIPHVLRASIAGFWVRSVEPPGRFSLEYWYAEAVVNDGCRYLRPHDGGTHAPDGEMYNLSWRLVLPTGSQYIVWRNRAAFEGVYIEVSRTEPDGWNGIDTI